MNRRDLLKLAAASTGLAFVRCSNESDVTSRQDLNYGLFFGEEALDGMRNLFASDERFAGLRKKLGDVDFDEVRRFIDEDVRYNDQLFDIARLGSTAEETAFLYLMTGDEDAALLSVECVRTIMRFERWDFFEEGNRTVGVQRAPHTTVSVSLAIDWLGDRVSDAERSAWVSVMGERGCEPCYLGLYGIRNPRDVEGWHFDETSTYFEHRPNNRTDQGRRPEITQTTNLRAVPANGLLVGATVHRLEFGPSPDVERWMEMGMFSIGAFRDIFKPDGSYHEGVGYADYTATQVSQAATLLNRHGDHSGDHRGDRADDLQLLDEINWKGYAEYVLNMSMATESDPYDIVNFGDNGNPKTGEVGTVTRTAVPFWIARQKRDGIAQFVGNNVAGGMNHWSLIWYDPTVEEERPSDGPQLWISELDYAVARNGWSDDALVVAMRSGAPANHEHADRNSIIVKCFGEQLVTDPYRPPYSFSDPAWRMRLTEGHSAVLIDGKGHEHHNGIEGTNASRSFARLLNHEQGDGYALWTSDATQPYRLVDTDIRRVERSVVVLFDVPAVIVVDRMTKWTEPSTLQARFFGYNWDGGCEQTVLDDGFMTQRPGAVMRGHVFSNVGFESQVGRLPIPEERAVRHPFAEVTTYAADDVLVVTALAIARDGEGLPEVNSTSASDVVDVRVDGHTVRVGADSISVG